MVFAFWASISLVAGINHDNVVHQKKKVKVKGVWKWQLPKYVRLVSHSIPGSKKKMTVKAGTQVIDRAWRFLKERIVLNQRCKVGTARLRAKVRSAQYEYWHRNEDLWLCTGELCTWQMKKIFLPTKWFLPCSASATREKSSGSFWFCDASSCFAVHRQMLISSHPRNNNRTRPLQPFPTKCSWRPCPKSHNQM